MTRFFADCLEIHLSSQHMEIIEETIIIKGIVFLTLFGDPPEVLMILVPSVTLAAYVGLIIGFASN